MRLPLQRDGWAAALRLERRCELVAFSGERERSAATLGAFAQLFAEGVAALERLLVQGDRRCELSPAAAVPPVQMLEIAPSSCERLARSLALPLELLLLVAEGVKHRVSRRSALVECKRLRCRAFQRPHCALGRGGRARLTKGRVAFEWVAAGEVEAGLEAGAAAGDIAPLLQRALVGEEKVGSIDGEALGGVAGERVAVVEVLGGVGEGDLPVNAGLVANDEALGPRSRRSCRACRCGARAGRRCGDRAPAHRPGARAHPG